MDILPTNEWDMVRSYDTDKTYDSIFLRWQLILLIRSKICSMKETGFMKKISRAKRRVRDLVS